MLIRPVVAISSCSLLLLGAAACGGGSPSASDKSADGARAAFTDYVTLVTDGKAGEACDKYMTDAIKQKMEQIGSCEKLIGAFAGQLPTVEQIQNVKITIDGNTARYALPNDTAEFTYVNGGWKVADDGEGTN